jgi:hypothetical protein
MTRTSDEIRAELDAIPGRVRALKDELQRASIKECPPVVQDYAYWISIYPDGNFPLGALD